MQGNAVHRSVNDMLFVCVNMTCKLPTCSPVAICTCSSQHCRLHGRCGARWCSLPSTPTISPTPAPQGAEPSGAVCPGSAFKGKVGPGSGCECAWPHGLCCFGGPVCAHPAQEQRACLSARSVTELLQLSHPAQYCCTTLCCTVMAHNMSQSALAWQLLKPYG